MKIAVTLALWGFTIVLLSTLIFLVNKFQSYIIGETWK